MAFQRAGGAGFAAQVAAFAEGSRSQAERYVREVTAEVARRVVDATPVDTGELAGNWEVSQSGAAPQSRRAPDPSKGATKARVTAEAATLTLGRSAFVVNDTSYGPFVEYGTSRIPPRAFVRRTAADLPAIAAQVAARLR